MTVPVIVPRAEHAISRKHIDPDALKVLYRLHQNNYAAYLVGGSVRDLLLGRRPKDFDIGTVGAPVPGQAAVPELLDHRPALPPGARPLRHEDDRGRDLPPAGDGRGAGRAPTSPAHGGERRRTSCGDDRDRLVHRDNTFGTPEEDAFRRDFTINALFYDIATFSIIDYTGGLEDLRGGVVRCIGDPTERFQEDPVRMLRAVAMAARLDFRSIRRSMRPSPRIAASIARSAPARLIEEFYKLLRSGAAEQAFRMLAERRLLEPIAPELQKRAGEASVEIARRARRLPRSSSRRPPTTLTNAVLLGSLLVPLGYDLRGPPPLVPAPADGRRRNRAVARHAAAGAARRRTAAADPGLQRRLVDMNLSPRAKRALMHRGPFREALTWLEIHGQAPDVLEHWRGFIEAAGTFDGERTGARRRHRRRRAAPHDAG